jgi:hypothetical protein
MAQLDLRPADVFSPYRQVMRQIRAAGPAAQREAGQIVRKFPLDGLRRFPQVAQFAVESAEYLGSVG